MQVRAQLVVMSWQIVIEAQERRPHGRWEADLEVVGKELELSGALAYRDREIKPRIVVAFEVRDSMLAILVLFAADDTACVSDDRERAQLLRNHGWRLTKNSDQSIDLIVRCTQ